MNAQETVKRLLEGDPDDPSTFIKHYQDAWERADFKQVEVTVTPQVRDILSTVPGSADEYRKYVWKEGIFSVEATEIGRGGGWEIYAFINNVAGDPEARSQSAYARKEAKTEQRALSVAMRLRNELENSMAAKLVRLGFVGWRNNWHKNSISVNLKPQTKKHGAYAHIKLEMNYLPNDAAIKALTTLNKVVGKFYPEA